MHLEEFQKSLKQPGVVRFYLSHVVFSMESQLLFKWSSVKSGDALYYLPPEITFKALGNHYRTDLLYLELPSNNIMRFILPE